MSPSMVASSAFNVLRWLCVRWRVASISSDVSLSAAVLRVNNWALIRIS